MIDPKKDFELNFFERLVARNPEFVDALIPLAQLYTRKGLYDKGLEVDQRLVRLRKKDLIVYYNLACSYALLNRKQEALRAIQRAVKLGYRDFTYMKQDTDLKHIHNHPKFKALCADDH